MIIVDTGPLVALCDRRDALHARAVGHLARLIDRPLFTVDGAIVEACFHLQAPTQRRRLAGLIAELEIAPVPETAGDWSDGFAWMERYADHAPDWTDASLAVAATQHPRAEVWTYDREFKTTWRRADGSRIPLAVPIP